MTPPRQIEFADFTYRISLCTHHFVHINDVTVQRKRSRRIQPARHSDARSLDFSTKRDATEVTLTKLKRLMCRVLEDDLLARFLATMHAERNCKQSYPANLATLYGTTVKYTKQQANQLPQTHRTSKNVAQPFPTCQPCCGD